MQDRKLQLHASTVLKTIAANLIKRVPFIQTINQLDIFSWGDNFFHFICQLLTGEWCTPKKSNDQRDINIEIIYTERKTNRMGHEVNMTMDNSDKWMY